MLRPFAIDWGYPAAVGSIVASIGASLVARNAMAAGLAGLALGLAAMSFLCRRRQFALLNDRLREVAGIEAGGATLDRFDTLTTAVERRLAAVEARLLHRHRVTNLPTREPLLQAMIGDGRGTLGVIALLDFDRMCAFDETLGERTMIVVVERVQRMVAPGRILAHVDRAQIAIWFGPDVARGVAEAELAALSYALGGRIDDTDSCTAIQPEVRTATAHLPDDGATPRAVLTRATALLAPTTGPSASLAAGNPVNDARERYETEQDLRQAVARGEFQMLYQPLVDSGSATVFGAEALLRWRHPTRGTISPAQFVPLMEAAGLADEVGLWALNAACREARQWQQMNLGPIHVAVNASGHQLDRADMRALVERTLARHALAPELLEIELTETVAAGDVTRAARLFDELREMGVRIAIDDFGTGYSSLSALRRLSFDKIKIDREFVTHVDTRRDSQAICQSIIALARGLGIRVLAEGVERAAEYRWLRSHGCHRFQGYYFAPPLEGEAFMAFVRDRAGLQARLSHDPRAAQGIIEERVRV